MSWKIYCLWEEFQEAGWSCYWHRERRGGGLAEFCGAQLLKQEVVRDGQLSGLRVAKDTGLDVCLWLFQYFLFTVV